MVRKLDKPETGIPLKAETPLKQPDFSKPTSIIPKFAPPTLETPKPVVAEAKAPVAIKSSIASEETLDLQRKLVEKEKAVVDLEEKLATLKQKRLEDKAKLKEFEKMKMQNQQVYA